ncbi:hypothetical protein BC567DRAFT_248982 [Phyllosticta citribraziliensis]
MSCDGKESAGRCKDATEKQHAPGENQRLVEVDKLKQEKKDLSALEKANGEIRAKMQSLKKRRDSLKLSSTVLKDWKVKPQHSPTKRSWTPHVTLQSDKRGLASSHSSSGGTNLPRKRNASWAMARPRDMVPSFPIYPDPRLARFSRSEMRGILQSRASKEGVHTALRW